MEDKGGPIIKSEYGELSVYFTWILNSISRGEITYSEVDKTCSLLVNAVCFKLTLRCCHMYSSSYQKGLTWPYSLLI
jgi:hypothetical protein